MDENPRIAELRKKLEKDPGSRLFAQLAEELRKEGKHEEAIGVASKGLEKNPNYPSARLTLARALLDSGRPREALPELEQVVKSSPDNILASRLLGDTLEDLGETAQALQQFERTLRLSPGEKPLIEKIADLRARLATPPTPDLRPASGAAVMAAPPPSAAPEVAAPAIMVEAPRSAAPDVPAAPASLALDRDLASGTFSPGSLNAPAILKHFAEVAAVSPGEAAAALPSIDDPVGFDEPRQLLSPVAALPSIHLHELPSVEMPPDDPELGAQTLPLTSVTLADLYLQQGLKAEASAVLSQVLKEEPENAQAKSKFAAVSDELAQTEPETAHPVAETAAPEDRVPSAKATVGAPRPRSPRTRTQIRNGSVISLKAFLSAVEREAIQQRATELSIR